MSLLLALGTEQIVLFVVLLAILILYPVFLVIRNKKATNQQQQVYDSLTKGDKVLMSCGIIGKVVKIETKNDIKIVVIETGDEKHKSFLTFDINAVYLNLTAQEAVASQTVEVQENEETVEVVNEEVKEEASAEETAEVQTNEQPVEEEKSEKKETAKKTTKKSSKKSK